MKRKIISLAVTSILTLPILGGLVACTPSQPTITSITATSSGDAYFGQDYKDLLTVKANYSDGSSVEITDYALSSEENDTTGKESIVVTYGDFFTIVEINTISLENYYQTYIRSSLENFTVENILLTTSSPEATIYIQNDTWAYAKSLSNEVWIDSTGKKTVFDGTQITSEQYIDFYTAVNNNFEIFGMHLTDSNTLTEMFVGIIDIEAPEEIVESGDCFRVRAINESSMSPMYIYYNKDTLDVAKYEICSAQDIVLQPYYINTAFNLPEIPQV